MDDKQTQVVALIPTMTNLIMISNGPIGARWLSSSKGFGVSVAATKHAVRYKQIDSIEALTELTDERCTNFVRNIRKVHARGSWRKFLTVSDTALNKFQVAVYTAKHAKRTNHMMTPHDIYIDSFNNLRA